MYIISWNVLEAALQQQASATKNAPTTSHIHSERAACDDGGVTGEPLVGRATGLWASFI
jgi:hypothetical protein